MNQKTGVKESVGKVAYDLDWEFIEAMALRMDENRHKYAVGNWKRPIHKADLHAAIARHHTEVQKYNYSEEGQPFPNYGHLLALACNAMMLYFQAKEYVERPLSDGDIEIITRREMHKQLEQAVAKSISEQIQKEFFIETTHSVGIVDPRRAGEIKFDPTFYDLEKAKEEEKIFKDLELQYIDCMNLPFKVNVYEQDTTSNEYIYDNTEPTELPIERSTEPVSRNRKLSELLEGSEEEMHRGFLEQRKVDAGETLFLRKLRNYQAEQNRLLQSEGDGASIFERFRMGTFL